MKDDRFKIIDRSGDRKYFTIVPNYIVNHSTVYEQAIYLYMKRVAGETGTCWESPKNIAKKLGIAPGTVRRYQKALVKRSWIEIAGTHRKTKPTIEYRIVDLWELNTKHYTEKTKGKEKSQNDFSQRKDTGCSNKSQLVTLEKAPDDNKEELSKEDLSKKIENIYTRYAEKINKFSHLTDNAKNKISAQLRKFQEDELLEAVDNFSQDRWSMENNAHRGVAWFFDNDDRIDQFMNLSKKKRRVGKYDHLVIRDDEPIATEITPPKTS
jgi:predicted ArsR family transcriptional regulator